MGARCFAGPAAWFLTPHCRAEAVNTELGTHDLGSARNNRNVGVETPANSAILVIEIPETRPVGEDML